MFNRRAIVLHDDVSLPDRTQESAGARFRRIAGAAHDREGIVIAVASHVGGDRGAGRVEHEPRTEVVRPGSPA